jgi:DNA (cytosine-5)-methyltransferase 1
MSQLVLSLFPGIGLLDRGFEESGFCVVRGPDLLFGGDIRQFRPPAGRFDGVIAGSPCQDFSAARRSAPSGAGVEMLGEFLRCVVQARPAWWLLENVPAVPDVLIDGYSWQRIDLRANEFGLPQQRLRHFQFGHANKYVLVVDRAARQAETTPACTASEGQRGRGRRDWQDFCAAQGLPADFALPALTLSARYRAVGNGVPVPMARSIADAIRDHLYPADMVRVCACGCGRRVSGAQQCARDACRKRLQRRRQRDDAAPALKRRVTPESHDAALALERRDERVRRFLEECGV